MTPHCIRRAFTWLRLVAAGVSPALSLHQAYYCFVGFALGFHFYPLPTHGTTIPDLVILLTLVVTCLVCGLLYPLHIPHITLDDSQRVLQEVGKRYSSEVVKALLQEVMLIPG